MASLGSDSAPAPRLVHLHRRPRRSILAHERLQGLPAWFWLGSLVAASVGVRAVVAAETAAPTIFPDELIYSDLAKSFAASGHFRVHGDPFSALSFGPLYPILIAPIYRFVGSASHAYTLVKLLNAVFISTAALPLYAIARRLLERRGALIAVALTVMLPSTIYSAKVMTESVAYPLFLTAILAMFRALERPAPRTQAVAVAAIAVASLARAQLIVLLPALALCHLLLHELELRGSGSVMVRGLRAIRSLWLVFGTLASGMAAFAAAWATRGGSGFFGSHDVAPGRLRLGAVASSILYHLADLDLYVGIIPLAAAVALLTAGAIADRQRVRRFAVVTGIVAVGLLLATAAYLTSLPSAHPHAAAVRVYDRYLFYVVPLVVIMFLAWLERGMPRTRVAVVAAVSASALPLVLPFSRVLIDGEWGVSSSNVALVPWGVISLAVSGAGWVPWAVGVYSFALGALFLRTRIESAQRLTLAVVLNICVIAAFVQLANAALAANAASYGVGKNAGWVDAAVGSKANVIAIWSGNRTWRGWYAIWDTAVLNRSVGRTYDLRRPMPYDPPGRRLGRDGNVLTFRGRPLRAEYVLTDESIALAGTRVAVNARTRMAVYRVRGIVRIRLSTPQKSTARTDAKDLAGSQGKAA